MSEQRSTNDQTYSRPRMLSVKDVAEILSTHPATVYRLITERKLAAKRIGERAIRIEASALERFIREAEVL